jgi:hypothetical protein
MKKLFSILLALCMAISLCVTASAEAFAAAGVIVLAPGCVVADSVYSSCAGSVLRTDVY